MIRLLSGVYWFDDALQAALKAAGWPPVTRTQSLLFAVMGTGERRPARLAAKLGISRQSMSEMLAQLAERRLVVLRDDPDDRRARIVTFCEEAAPIRHAVNTVLRQLEDELKSRIGDAAFAALSVGLLGDWGPSPTVEAPKIQQRSDNPSRTP